MNPRLYQTILIQACSRRLAEAPRGKKLVFVIATGGGKTLVMVEVIADAVRNGKRVLVLSKDWRLVAQVVSLLRDRHPDIAVGTYGQNGQKYITEVGSDLTASVVTTTLATWHYGHLRDSSLQETRFDLVLIDEVHWGEDAAMQGRLTKAYEDQAVFLGATATPRASSDFELVGREYGLGELVEQGYLARPVLTRVLTDEALSADTSRGDFQASSLRDLATREHRNHLIVQTYVNDNLGKSIIFACDIEHAKRLAELFVHAGVAAAALHSQLDEDEQQEVLTAFREGRLQVVVGIAMLTHGLDVPDIQSVLLARPTASDILMAQMIGRGSRLANGKTTFNVVDFVDNVETHGLPVVRPDGFLGSRRGPPFRRHAIEPAQFVIFEDSAYPDLAGYEIHPGQTFGIEFELTPVRGWFPNSGLLQKGDLLLSKLRGVVPAANVAQRGGFKDNSLWNVELDFSCGIELTSRILLGPEGFAEVADVLAIVEPAASELGLTVGVRTGTHIHLAWTANIPNVRRLLELTAHYEPALLSLVAPSRATSPYTQSVMPLLRSTANLKTVAQWKGFLLTRTRYHIVNLRSLFLSSYGTVEIRLHSGTVEAAKILRWVSLWMRILSAAENPTLSVGNGLSPARARPLCPDSRGDIAELCHHIGVGNDLKESLVARREQVVRQSWLQSRYRDSAEQALEWWRSR